MPLILTGTGDVANEFGAGSLCGTCSFILTRWILYKPTRDVRGRSASPVPIDAEGLADPRY